MLKRKGREREKEREGGPIICDRPIIPNRKAAFLTQKKKSSCE